MVLEFLSKIAVWGMIGLLIEVFFTGFHNLIIERSARAMGTTYLWMLPIYGFAGELLALLRNAIHNGWLFVPLAVVLIFLIEFGAGWLLRKVIGRCPWDYGPARFGIMGLVRLDYLPFWLAVALGFDAICDKIGQAITFFYFHT